MIGVTPVVVGINLTSQIGKECCRYRTCGDDELMCCQISPVGMWRTVWPSTYITSVEADEAGEE